MIFIVGVPRSGKTTLAKRLKEKYNNSNIISCDAIKKSMGILDLCGGAVLNSAGLIKYVAKIAEWNEISTGQKSIIDAGLIPIECVFEIVKPGDRVVCLGFGGKLGKEEIWASIQNYQQEFDSTCSMDLNRAVHYWGDFGRRDQNNRYFCVDKDLIYLDTKDHQAETIKYIVDILRGDFEK